MQLSSKTIKVQDLEKELVPLVKQNSLDFVVGSMHVTTDSGGLFVLLFSHRMNKEIPIIISGSHQQAEILNRVQKVLETSK